jgi:hypothetical protein
MPVDVMADDFLCGEVRRLASVGKGDPLGAWRFVFDHCFEFVKSLGKALLG